jgi:hypothetical protein
VCTCSGPESIVAPADCMTDLYADIHSQSTDSDHPCKPAPDACGTGHPRSHTRVDASTSARARCRAWAFVAAAAAVLIAALGVRQALGSSRKPARRSTLKKLRRRIPCVFESDTPRLQLW